MRGSRWLHLVMFGLAICSAGGSAYGEDDSQSRLRATLRQVTIQMRDLEDQNATLSAKQAEMDRERQSMTQKLQADEKELVALRGQVQSGRELIDRAQAARAEDRAKWEAAYKDAADKARTRDADAKNLADATVKLREQLHAAEDKNEALYKLGQELLDLYDNKGLLTVLGGSEPVTKLKRVEYENLMQDYQDRLRANHIEAPVP